MKNTLLLLHADEFKDSSMFFRKIKNNGTLIQSNGKFDKCFSFGNSDVEVGKLDLLDTDFTIEFWLKLENLTSTNYVFGDNVDSVGGFRCNVVNGVLTFHSINGVQVEMLRYTLDASITTSFKHIAIVKNDNKIILYVDGINVSENTFIEQDSSNNVFRIGRNSSQSSTNALRGFISEFRISNIARYVDNFVPNTTKHGIDSIGSIKEAINTYEALEIGLNTNLDNFKANLIDKGVEVSETDKMSSMIDKIVDLSNIDIVVKSELPSTVKNGQIVIVDDLDVLKITLDTKPFNEANIDNNCIYIQLTDNTSELALKNAITSNKHEFLYYIDSIYKKINSEMTPCNSIFKGIDGEWVQVLDSKFDIFSHGKYQNSYSFTQGYASNGSGSISLTGNYTDPYNTLNAFLKITSSSNSNISFVTTNTVDVTRFNKIIFNVKKLYCSSVSPTPKFSVGISAGKNDSANNMLAKKIRNIGGTGTTLDLVMDVDISNISGLNYIHVALNGATSSGTLDTYFDSIYLLV